MHMTKIDGKLCVPITIFSVAVLSTFRKKACSCPGWSSYATFELHGRNEWSKQDPAKQDPSIFEGFCMGFGITFKLALSSLAPMLLSGMDSWDYLLAAQLQQRSYWNSSSSHLFYTTFIETLWTENWIQTKNEYKIIYSKEEKGKKEIVKSKRKQKHQEKYYLKK